MMHRKQLLIAIVALSFVAVNSSVAQPKNNARQSNDTQIKVRLDKLAEAIEPKVIAWRRDFHEFPELSNREFRTSKVIAEHLENLKLDEVRRGVGKTGVVGILKGGLPGPVVALRADMDGLPITENTGLPFASKAKAEYNGHEVGVMHACGHDSHVAILMGVAEVLSQVRQQLRGTVVFIFQPAEEGPPAGERGGAELMVDEGVLENPKVEVIFGLHINSMTPAGVIRYRAGGVMASADHLYIKVNGKGVHASRPWGGNDPITAAGYIITGLQTVVSRMTPITDSPVVVSIGSIEGGNRGNIIPDFVEMRGTIRTLDPEVQKEVHENIRKVVTNIAESQGTTADVVITKATPITFNNPELTRKMLPTLEAVAGEENVKVTLPITGAEDFAEYQLKIPGMFFFLGGMAKDMPIEKAPEHHTAGFMLDESGFTLGVKAFCHLVVDYAEKP